MQTESIPLDALHQDPANVRKHSPKNLAAIQASLARFGQQKPIVVNTRNVVLAGNGTLEAARALGWTHLTAVRTGLTGPDAVAYAIADNRTAELAEWDQPALLEQLVSLRDDPAADVLATGFDGPDLDTLLQSMRNDADDAEHDPDAEPPEVPIHDAYHVLVNCRDEAHQQEIYERMTAEGLKCRLLMM